MVAGQPRALPRRRAARSRGARRAGATTAAIEKRLPVPLDADGHHALGLIDLWSLRPADAVAHLETAAAAAPASPAIHNDLAVALLARWTESANHIDLARALDAVAAAADLTPDRPEVMFNLALLLTRLGLQEQARERWLRFARLETAPAWKSEGAALLAPLEGPSYVDTWNATRAAIAAELTRGDSTSLDAAVKDHLQPIRQWGEEVVLADWAAAYLARDAAKAQASLQAALAIGAAVRRRSSDAMLEEAAQAIARLDHESSRSAAKELARGHQAFAAGLADYRSHQVAGAMASFSSAESALTAGGSPFRHWATFYRAACLYQLTRNEESAATFAGISKLTARSSYVSLHGRLHWSEGLLHLLAGAPTTAQAEYEEGLRVFVDAGEWENAAMLRSLIAETYYYYYGLPAAGWAHLYPALQLQSKLLDARRRELILFDAALSAADAGLARAASLLMAAATDTASNPVEEATARLRLADFEVRAGHLERASSDLQRVQALLGQIDDLAVRSVVEAELRLAEGTVVHRHDPRAALAALSAAIRLFTSTHGEHGLLAALIERGQLLTRLGNNAAARDDLDAAVRQLETLGQQSRTASSRHQFLDHRYRLVESLVALELTAGDDRKALTWVDSFRDWAEHAEPSESPASRAGAEQENGKQRSPETLVAPGSVAFYFVLLPDRLVSWCITSQAIRRVETTMSHAEIVGRVERLAANADRAQLEAMFDLLLGPYRDELAHAASVTIIPDRALNLVPFAALRDATSGRYLVETHDIQLSPRLVAMPATPTALSRPQRVLAVGNPILDEALAARLEPIPETAREARDVGVLYQRADVLLGSDATPSRWMALARHVDVLHVSSHAVSGGGAASGRLLLAADALRPASGVLSAEDIGNLQLSGAPLVFLSVCHGAAGPVGKSAGPASLANAFLSAGARAVVASLWPVDDRAAYALALEFHRQLLRSGVPASALALAQRALLRSGDPALTNPRSWSAFVLIQPPGRPPRAGK